MDRAMIERYAQGASAPKAAIAGLSAKDLNAFPVPGTWSIQQIVLHLLDSDLVGADRMKRVIAQDSPQLLAYDETAFANRLHYAEQDIATACEVFCLNRLLVATMLRQLPDAAFARRGTHSEHGSVALADLVATYVDHLDHHLKFIHDKRRLLGKPLA